MKTFTVTVTLRDAEARNAQKTALLYRMSLTDFLGMALETGIDYSSHILEVADVEPAIGDLAGFYEDEDGDDTV